jgi:putative glutamine amidotransferase
VPSLTDRPRILLTRSVLPSGPSRALAERKLTWYREAIERAGGTPLDLSPEADHTARGSAFRVMDGLLISGGADLDPVLYGEAAAGTQEISRPRDALEQAAFRAAADRARPVLGICRGLQAINVFSGGSLVQHVDGHDGPDPGTGPARTHGLVVPGGSRLAAALGLPSGGELEVNSYHHQAVTPERLAPGLIATAWSRWGAERLVEGLEAAGERFVVAVQCHPERVGSTPAAFEGLFAAFIDAASEGRVRTTG